MEANKNIRNFILNKPCQSENGGLWKAEEIARLIAKLKSESLLTGKQFDRLMMMLNQKDSPIHKISKAEVNQSKLCEFLSKEFLGCESFQNALNLLCDSSVNSLNPSYTIVSLKSIRRILHKIIQGNLKSRIISSKNFLVKKYIVDFAPAISVLKSLGFETMNKPDSIDLILPEDLVGTLQDKNVLRDIDNAISTLSSKKCFDDNVLDKPKQPAKTDRKEITEKESTAKDPNQVKKKSKSPKRGFCINNCGFFGSESTSGYCSFCFKEKNPNLPKPELQLDNGDEQKNSKGTETKEDITGTKQKDKTRCWRCGKKIGYINISCDCEYIFCARHRSPLDHDCTFDHKKKFESKLIKENPKISSNKIDKV